MTTRASPIQLCLFDTQAGTGTEEQSCHSILAFYPVETSSEDQCQVIGLLQATLTLISTFRAAGAYQVVQTEHYRWILLQCEPDVWLTLGVSKAWQKLATEEALYSNLRKLHHFISVLRGPVRQLLSQGGAANKVLESLVAIFGCFLEERAGVAFSFQSLAATYEALPCTHLQHRDLHALATLVNRALMSSSWNESPLVGMLLLHEERLLWSNLSLQDTSSLQHLISCMLQPAIWTAYSGFLKAPLTGNARDASNKLLMTLNLRGSTEQGLEAILSSSTQEGLELNGNISSLRVWSQATQQWCSLHFGNIDGVTIAVLLPENMSSAQSSAEQLLARAAPSLKSLGSSLKISAHVSRSQDLSNLRYILLDPVAMSIKSRHGKGRTSHLQPSSALMKDAHAHIARQLAGSQTVLRKFAELVLWRQDCWVFVRHCNARAILLVVDNQAKDGLIDATSNIHKTIAKFFPEMHP